MAAHFGTTSSVHWTLLVGSLTQPDLDRFVEHLRSPPPKGRYAALEVVHSRDMPRAKVRNAIADAVSAADHRRVAGHALVTSSSLIRGVLTAVNWVITPKFPERVVATPDEAFTWFETLGLDGFDRSELRRALVAADPAFDTLRW